MRLFGHPVHAIVVALPLALLAMAPIWDFLTCLGLLGDGRLLAYYSLLAGLLGGGLALLTGVAELIVVSKTRPEVSKYVVTHAGVGFGALSLFVLAFVFRGGKNQDPVALVLGFECAGAAVLGLTGWLGGHLIFEHRIGVRGVSPGVRDPAARETQSRS
jgi:uncharacterized membrane protein